MTKAAGANGGRGNAGWRPLRLPSRADESEFVPSPLSRLVVAHALTVAGDTMITVALAGSLFFSISPAAARGRVALSLAFTVAPFAVVAPLLGPAIDRRRAGRKTTIVLSAAARAVTCLVMARVVHGLTLFPAAFASLVLSKAHAVAKSSLVPSVVDDNQDLVEANAKLALTAAVVGFIASVPAVAILKLAGAAWLLRAGAVVFAVAGVAATRIDAVRAAGTPPDAAAVTDSERRWAPPATEAVAPPVTAGVARAAAAMAVLRAAVGFLTFLVAFSLRRDHAPSWVFGIALAASLAGSIIGAALAPGLRGRFSEERILTGSLLVVSVVAFGAFRTRGRLAAPLVALALGAAAAAGKLAFEAIVQRELPPGVRARRFARFEATFQLVWVAGALVPVVLRVPMRGGLVALGLASLAGALVSIRGRRRL